MLDYPGRIAATLFCGGCNFRCPYCHNRDLVERPQDLPDIPLDDIWAFLDQRRGLLDGVVISGGEPTLQPDLISFALRLRREGLAVKLDTNGYAPDLLQAAIEAGALDYVAMDIKSSPGGYAQAVGIAVDMERIDRSVRLLLQGRVEYEFRTTVAPGLLNEKDIAAIAHWIAGARQYSLQQFVPRHTLDPAMLKQTPYSPTYLRALAEQARPLVQAVLLCGV